MRYLTGLILPLAILLGGCTGHHARDVRTAATIVTAAAFVASVASEDAPVASYGCSGGVEYVEARCSCSVYGR